tara:strand:+ start:1322 stop:1939 length:618 start_codon:yes stop_codon:yes gene_type:complete
MKKNYQARLAFPTVFHEYSFNKKDFKKNKLIDFCYAEKKQNPKGLKRSNRGGWHSRVININEDNPISSHLKNGLGKSVFTTLSQKLSVHVEYWIMINSPNTYNCSHTHPNSHLSGVFWINAPKKSGDLKFINPSNFQTYVELQSYVEAFKLDTNVYESYIFTPTVGKMVTFPSHVIHEVLNNESNEDRIAVSYNVTLSGWDKDEK